MTPYSRSSNHAKRRTYRARKRWLKLYPPDEQGNYLCALCKEPVPKDKMTLDHIKEAVLIKNDREYYDMSNLQPAHYKCNVKKNELFLEKHKDRLKARQPNVIYHRKDLNR